MLTKEVTIGENTRIIVNFCSTILKMSYSEIQLFLNTFFGFKISDGEIAHILEGESKILIGAYNQIKEAIRSQAGVHYDETGWPVQQDKLGNYCWAITGTETNDVIYALGRSRGKGNAEELMGDNNDQHVGISDNYPGYKNIFKRHQNCWAHPLRKIRDLVSSPTLSASEKMLTENTYKEFQNLYYKVSNILKEPFDLNQRKKIKKNLMNEFLSIIKLNKGDPKRLIIYKETLKKNKESYFTCIIEKGIPPDNNKAERVLRHMVLKRKNSLGSKTQKGADIMSINYSVLLSIFWKNPTDFFGNYRNYRDMFKKNNNNIL